MSCTDCFNGCTNTTPDKCVKYTGVDHTDLNIHNGDSLFSVEEKIIMSILNFSIGVGILPEIDSQIICAEVMVNLPDLSVATLNDYLSAIIQAACKNGADIQTINTKLTALNSAYVLSCLTGITTTDGSDTHKVLQAVINNFCTLQTNVTALSNSLSNYVKISDINSYIDAYLTSKAPGNLVSAKMIPYVAVEYYGSLSNFDAGGKGLDLTSTGGPNWTKVYLCNGANGTPDKRGRVGVGITNVPGGGAYNPAVDPAVSGNPTYVMNTPLGANTVTLDALQIPPHTHLATSVVSGVTTVVVPFVQEVLSVTTPRTLSYNSVGDQDSAIRITETANVNTSGTIVTTTNASTGGGLSHSNIQPVLPCYYIMYIP